MTHLKNSTTPSAVQQRSVKPGAVLVSSATFYRRDGRLALSVNPDLSAAHAVSLDSELLAGAHVAFGACSAEVLPCNPVASTQGGAQ